jgi:benzylsuccinate CoA-transferase BbsF subunit
MVHQAIGGGAYITGYPDDHPSHSGGDMDLMNAITTAYAVVAALHHRNRTGEGQFIDYSQCEGVTSLLGEVMLGYEMTGEIPERMGNAHPFFAPHNVYRCWGVDRWLALEIHSDEEFAKLARIIGKPELAEDARFADMASRKKNETELDQIIESWTRERDRDWMVEEFCGAGLAAAPSRDGRDLYADPHLRARGAFVKINHPELGELEMVGPPWKLQGCDLPTSHAPLIGEHNRYVLGDLLGLSEKEIADLRSKEIIM